MNKLDVTKNIVRFVVGAGVTKIVNDVISNNTNPEKVTEKVTIVAGGVVLGMMASDASKVYTSAKIDEYVAAWKNLKSKMDEVQKNK